MGLSVSAVLCAAVAALVVQAVREAKTHNVETIATEVVEGAAGHL